MNFFKIIFIFFSILFFNSVALSESHDKDQKNIVEKAKEINQKVKKDQALKNANIASEVGKEEPLHLNDPFVGDGSLGGSGSSIKLISDSKLRGLGGAGFPAGKKWEIVRSFEGPRLMTVNGDEGEPGTFKDRFWLVR